MNIRINRFPTVIAGALVCATSLASGTAQALSCAVYWSEAPVEGAQGVPTNTLIWGYGRSAENHMQLVGPQGSVPLVELFLPVVAYSTVTHYPVLEPLEDLEPGASYWLEWSYPGAEPGELSRVSFTTGAGPWTTPPPVPELIASESSVGSTWLGGLSRAVQLDFEHQGFLVGDADGALGDVSSLSFVAVVGARSTPSALRSVGSRGELLGLSTADRGRSRAASRSPGALLSRRLKRQIWQRRAMSDCDSLGTVDKASATGCGVVPSPAHRRGDFWATLAVGSAISLFRRRRRPQT